MRYLSADEVVAIHFYVMRELWNEPLYGLRDRPLLESAVNRPVSTALYTDSDVFDQAAKLLEGLTANHPFLQGNKRTAYAATELFLLLNGWRCDAEDQQLISLCLGIAMGNVGAEAAGRFLRDNSVPWSQAEECEQ